MSTSLKLIVGLGNPGKQYATTRHNAGAWWLQQLCEQQNITLRAEPKFFGLTGKFALGSASVICLLPTTYMNLSGKAVASIAKYYSIAASEILVAHDELDLPAGKIRLKSGGGHGGHNGLRDLLAHLGTPDFHRLRIGINHPGHKDLVSDYVLQAPNKTEQLAIEQAIAASLSELPNIVMQQFALAMNKLHLE